MRKLAVTRDWVVNGVGISGSPEWPEKCLIIATIWQAVTDKKSNFTDPGWVDYRDFIWVDHDSYISDMVSGREDSVYAIMTKKMLER